LAVDGNVVAETEDSGYGHYERFGTCTFDCLETTLTLKLDYWGLEDNSMSLTDVNSGAKIWDTPSFNRLDERFYPACLERDGCFELMINDSYGDG
jgi:hypothetical protein